MTMLTMAGTVEKAISTSKLIVMRGMMSMTKNNGAIHALAFSKPAQIRPSCIQLVNTELVRNSLSIANAGVQVSQIRQPHKIETIKNGRKLSHNILGCIVPTNAKPNDLITCCNPTIKLLFHTLGIRLRMFTLV
jgi:hypothetical protein